MFQIIFENLLKSVESKHSLLGTILVCIDLILWIYKCSTNCNQRMINWYSASFTIWVLFVVLNQVMLSVSFQFNPSCNNDIWKIIDSIILSSCPGIVSLSVRMIGNLNIVNWVMSKFYLSHCLCLDRFFLIQTFNNVRSHRNLCSENSIFASSSLRNSFFDIIYFNTLSCVSYFYNKSLCLYFN